MEEKKRVLRVVVASPNDVQLERDALPSVFDELNRGVAAERQLLLELHRYETDTYPGFHEEGPQGLIDPILKIEDCDILIGIFWKRFGTPTLNSQSGTEHEIQLALNAWERKGRPQVLLYFNRSEYYAQSLEELDQIRRIMEFEQRVSNNGLRASYKGLAEFKDLVRVNLSNLIRNSFPPAQSEIFATEALEGSIQSYRKHLAQQVGTIRIFDDANLHPLQEVFVELNITEEYERPRIATEVLGLMDFALRRQRDPYSVEEDTSDSENEKGQSKRALKPIELLLRHVKAVIAGAPGCGKTTLLKYLVLRTLTEEKRFPVHLELKTINRQLFTELKEDLAELLFEKAVAGLLQLKNSEERVVFRNFFFELLKRGEVSIFLDGLDEVHGEEFFPNLCKSINAFMRSIYRHNDLVITTRPYALVTRFEGMVEMEIAPLNQRQIQAFLDHYYGATPVAKQLSKHLRRHRELNELARVPFLLGLIAELYRQQAQIVGVRLQLYREIIKRLVTKLDKEKSVDRFLVKDPNGTYKRDLLKRLAYDRLFVDVVDKDIDRLVFTDDDILKKARQVLRVELQPEHLVSDVIATPLLREVASNTYAFSHLTIQEYLAAEALSEQENCERLFCQKIFNPTVVAMEVLPKALGLISSPNSIYRALEQLPESLIFTNLRLRARGTSYLDEISEQHLNALINQVVGYLTTPYMPNSAHLQIIISSFVSANNYLQKSLTEKVIPLLRSQNTSVRLRATSLLGELGAESAVDELLVRILDVDGKVANAAATALGKIGDDRTIDGLFVILDSCQLVNTPEISFMADSTESEISSATDSTESEISSAADSTESQTYSLTAVVKSGGSPQGGRISDLGASKNVPAENPLAAALGALQQIGNARVMDGLFDMMKDERWFLRERVARVLGSIGDLRSVNCLTVALRDEVGAVREAAAVALGQLKDVSAIKSLVEVIQTDDGKVRLLAVESLGLIGNAAALTPLLTALKIQNVDLRRKIAKALGDIGDERAVDWLTVLLKQGKPTEYVPQTRSGPELHQEVIQALVNIGNTSALEAILGLLNRDSVHLRWMAAVALGEIGDARAVDALLAGLEDRFFAPREAAAEALGKIGDRRAIDGLLRAIEDSKAGVRAVAAQALSKVSNTYVVGRLVEILRHKNLNVRLLAAKTLGNIGGAQATPGLIGALMDEKPSMRWAAVVALGKLVDRRAVESLLVMLNDPALDVRRAAAEALGKIGDQRAVDALLEILSDKDEAFRGLAAEALGKISDVRATERLITGIKNDTPGVRWNCAKALGKMNDERAVRALLEALPDTDPRVRRTIVDSLGLAGVPAAIGGLLTALKDEDGSVRQAALAELRKQGIEVLAEGLEEALSHSDDFVRKRAAQGVGYYSSSRAVLEKLSGLAKHDPVEDVRKVADAARARYACKLSYFA